MDFVDSSVVIAASLPNDPRQQACVRRLALMDKSGGACAAHTLSETFAVLTRLPLPFRVPAPAAMQIVQHTSQRYSIIALTPAEQLVAMHRFVALGLTGAMIFDALILAAARKAGATTIYTLDQRHFHRIAPDLTHRIVLP